MIPELGHFALILALILALVQCVFPLIGAARGIPNWMAVARPAAVGQFVFISLAYFSLTYAFIQNDFSVLYVASNSNTSLPLIYRIVSVWGGHEGSLLLWSLILAGWMVAVVWFSRSLPEAMVARVLAVMGFISMGFLLFMLVTSNPFDRLVNPPLNGRDLNPLLQDPGLIIHPPMLYMGYVGFSVAFSFAIAALLGGTLDSAWARWSRPWTLVAWIFLTLGIALGSWWAYYELGWGGWWFWDPVENASFMPWLVGTALIHSLAVTEKRSTFKNWTVLLAIIAFSLSLLGTFLVRSGVLTSVHAFATDPARGTFILIFLGVVIGTSLTLYAWRAPKVGGGGSFSLISRETFLLMNNILLVVACGMVLLGTLYPLFLDALNLGKISVGPPYFSTMFTLLISPLIFLVGIGTLSRWKKDELPRLQKLLMLSFVMSIVLGIAIPVLTGTLSLGVVAGIAGASWIVLTSIQAVREKLRNKTALGGGLRSLSQGFYGMLTAHVGISVFVIGVMLSSAFSVEQDVRVEPNKSTEIAGHRFLFEGTQKLDGANYSGERGTFRVFKDNKEISLLQPEKRIYRVQAMPMTEAAIDPSLARDIYIALGEPLGNGAWSARIYYKPFIRWIWLGALFMVAGGIISVFDPRYRRNALRSNHAVDGAVATA
jgi:cytochrome c-type biogenesis protein CcmF